MKALIYIRRILAFAYAWIMPFPVVVMLFFLTIPICLYFFTIHGKCIDFVEELYEQIIDYLFDIFDAIKG